MTHHWFLSAAACILVCGQPAVAADPSVSEIAGVLSGDAAGNAADNPQCRMFTPDEIAGYLGAPVAPGENAGMGMGCQWVSVEGYDDVMVTVVPAEYADRPSLAPGFREVPSIGPDAYVAEDMGGWVAGVTTGSEFVKVSVSREGATADQALALLAEALKRRGN